MSRKTPEFEVKVEIPETAKIWPRLVKEIPRGSALQSAHLMMTPKRTSVVLYFVGRRADGEMHKRTSVQQVTIATNFSDVGDVREVLRQAFPKQWADRFADMSVD